MPLYKRTCLDSSCNCSKEQLESIYAEDTTTCPECGKETFAKDIVNTSFQLAGGGWYRQGYR